MTNTIVYEIFTSKWLLLTTHGTSLIINKSNLLCCKIRLRKLIKNVEAYEMILCTIFWRINHGKKKKYYLQKMPYYRYWWTKSKTTVHDRGKSENFCLLTYYPFDGVDALHLLICNTIMNYKFITFVIHDTLAYDCF